MLNNTIPNWLFAGLVVITGSQASVAFALQTTQGQLETPEAGALAASETSTSRNQPFNNLPIVLPPGLIGSAQLVGDSPLKPEQILGNLAACQLVLNEIKDLASEELFTQTATGCESTKALTPPLFSDAQCENAITVRRESVNEYCSTALNKTALGDGSRLPAQVDTWELTQGTSLEFTLPDYENDTLKPYSGAVKFRETSSDKGTCSLEMRIYTQNPGATNLKPMIAFHGGSWSQRGGGFVGLESLTPHFTSRDMIVFAPFYRLAGNKEGPYACRGFVAEDIVADAEAALDWVKTNGSTYGAADGEVSLFGQSAGGFLAAWLALNRPAEIDDALLMYPPTDLGAFVDELESGEYTNENGQEIIETFLGEPRENWKNIPERLEKLSLAARAEATEGLPPIQMLHGKKDELVLPSQSEYLCDALNFGRESEESSNTIFSTETCGPQGKLTLLEQGEHAMELCLLSGVQCLAGDIPSADALDSELLKAYDWLSEDRPEFVEEVEEEPEIVESDSPTDTGTTVTENTSTTAESTSSTTGGGAVVFSLLPLLLLTVRRNKKAA